MTVRDAFNEEYGDKMKGQAPGVLIESFFEVFDAGWRAGAAATSAVAAEDARATLVYQIESTMTMEQAPAEEFNADCYVVPVESIRAALAATPHPAPAVAAEAGQGEREQLRKEQAETVMPLIGPLLDAWEGMHNDDKEVLREESADLANVLDEIGRAMDGATQPAPPSQGQTAMINGLSQEETRASPSVAGLTGRTQETDSDRLDWLEQQAKKSRTGVSLTYDRYVEDGQVLEHGYRFMRRHFATDFKRDIRSAIDAARAAPTQPPAEGGA